MSTTDAPRARAVKGGGPERRRAILDATARVIATGGIRALTFRAVAREAGVPLGSTTYYFDDKEHLLREALQDMRDRTDDMFREVLAGHLEAHALPDAIAHTIAEMTSTRHDVLVAGVLMYMSAASDETVRAGVEGWTFDRVLDGRCDAQTAELLAFTIDGMLMKSAAEGIAFEPGDLVPHLRRLLG